MRCLLVGMIVGLLVNSSLVCRGETPEPPAKAPAVRQWTDSTGRFHMEGILLGGDQSHVRLQKVQGSVITVALDRLSERDRRFALNSLASPSAHIPQTTPRAAGESSVAAPATGDMGSLASVGQLIFQSTQPMPENMIYVRLSRQFLQRMARHDVAERRAVHDTILGCDVVGVSQTVGSTDFELQPSDRCGLAEIHFCGTTTYNTVADAGRIQVLVSGVTRFASAKAFRFDADGIHLGQAATNARTSSTITGIQTSLPGLRGRIALRIGGPRAEESRPAAEAITAAHTQRDINQGFDNSASQEIADLWKAIGAQIASLPADHPLRQCSWRASSSKDALQIVLLAPPADNQNRVPAPSPMLADAEIEVQVHNAFVRRVMADMQFQQLLQPLHLASTPASMPAGRPVMRWSNDHNWLSLSWQSVDRPAEPAQTSAQLSPARNRLQATGYRLQVEVGANLSLHVPA